MWRRKAPAAQGAHRAGAKILADAHPHIGRQIANGERLAAAGFCNSLLQRGEDRLRLLRRHKDRQSAVFHLARSAQSGQRNRGSVNL